MQFKSFHFCAVKKKGNTSFKYRNKCKDGMMYGFLITGEL